MTRIAAGMTILLLLLEGGAGAQSTREKTVDINDINISLFDGEGHIFRAQGGMDRIFQEISHGKKRPGNFQMSQRLDRKGAQDLSTKYVASLTKSNTIIIDNDTGGGDCNKIGEWDPNTRKCTLTANLTKMIKINSNGITLDGNGHTLKGKDESIGIYLDKVSGITIRNLSVRDFDIGILMMNSLNNTLIGNNASNNFVGIYLDNSKNNTLSRNNLTRNDYNGINLYSSRNNTLIGNSASDNSYGINLYNSGNNLLKNNMMTENAYNFVLYGDIASHFQNQIDTSNTVDGNPIYYIKGARNTIYDSSTNAGTFYCINCLNVTVKDLKLKNNDKGIIFWNTSYSRIQNVSALDNSYGISLIYSSNNTLSRNNITKNDYYGINLDHSSKNTLSGNNIEENSGYGINLYSSKNNTLIGNNASNNYGGIGLYNSRRNTLIENTASHNKDGIILYYSGSSQLINNLMRENKHNFFLYGFVTSDFQNQIDTSNTVDGKPIYYIIGARNTIYDSYTNAGTFYCIDCLNVTVKDLILKNNGNGIFFWNTSYSRVQNVNASDNLMGIYIVSSGNNTFSKNNVLKNGDFGIILDNSISNTFSENNVRKSFDGIYLISSSNNTFSRNNVIENDDTGINMYDSGNNSLSRNNVTGNNYYGVSMSSSSNNTLSGNTASNNGDDGIILYYSSNNNLNGNIARNNKNDDGIQLIYSEYNTLIDNIALNNYYDGIYLSYSNKNVLKGNNASSNRKAGIGMSHSNSNTLTGNIITGQPRGIKWNSGRNNTIYNNYFNNTNNSNYPAANGTWNTTIKQGPNIVGGPYIGGNFWGNPNGTGFSQICKDGNKDGLCDSEYKLEEKNIDYLPLSMKFIKTS